MFIALTPSLSVRPCKLERKRRSHCIWSSIVGEGRLELERLLDLVGAHIRVLAVFQEARALVLADELDERRSIRLPVLGEALEVLEDRLDAVTS